MFTFVVLHIPHIGRSLVGTDHKVLIPFSAIMGALLILIADTLGRTVMAPIEIPASILLAVIGGPFLIFLLRKSDRIYGIYRYHVCLYRLNYYDNCSVLCDR